MSHWPDSVLLEKLFGNKVSPMEKNAIHDPLIEGIGGVFEGKLRIGQTSIPSVDEVVAGQTHHVGDDIPERG